ncbi:MAG: flagellar export protein FliJ [Rhodoferax sp.]
MSQFNAVLLAIELATRQRDAARKVLAQVNRNLAFAEGQMAQLESYAAETDARWTGAAPGTLSAELIHHHYQFMERLQQAIRMQNGVIESTQLQIERASKSLMQTESRLAGLNQVYEARLAAAALTERRREQLRTDEFAALTYRRNRPQAMRGEHHGH